MSSVLERAFLAPIGTEVPNKCVSRADWRAMLQIPAISPEMNSGWGMRPPGRE